MKKILAVLLILMIIIVIVVVFYYKDIQAKKQEIDNFNRVYLNYNKDNLNGLDITTIINRAISNNEKYAIAKDEEGLYVLDDEYSN